MDNLPAFHDAFHIHIQKVHPAIAHGGGAHTATPTHESYAAAKPSILAWLFHRADLGVTYGASHLTCAADLLPPKDALLPMGDVCDYSLFCARWTPTYPAKAYLYATSKTPRSSTSNRTPISLAGAGAL